jgi:hypothetical protein
MLRAVGTRTTSAQASVNDEPSESIIFTNGNVQGWDDELQYSPARHLLSSWRGKDVVE